jgi:SOS-response transcriptional repressor LexA
MAIALTEKQADVLEYITLEIQKGMPPTVREVASAFSVSTRAVYDSIRAIEKRGYIRRGSMRQRDIVLTDKALAENASLGAATVDLPEADRHYASGRAHEMGLPGPTAFVCMLIKKHRDQEGLAQGGIVEIDPTQTIGV